ncbi:MAG: FprA family A-type flavoprotein [Anaerolineae bacterium]
MDPRPISDRVTWLGGVDWHRRLFDALVPLPDGTSYNAYLVEGREKTALLDTVDPRKTDELMAQLAEVERIDYVVAHHAEQDHAGTLPELLSRYPEAVVLATERGKGMLIDLLHLDERRVQAVDDGDTVSLGDRTLHFIAAPWVHWPETMLTYVPEEQMLFTCDFFGSHYASSELYVDGDTYVVEAAKRYYAEIMMPFRLPIKRHLDKLANYDFAVIAPSHGPIWDKPQLILDAYRDWVSGPPKNLAVVPFISMHGSTAEMVDHLVAALVARDVRVEPFDLTVTDLGDLAMALVDAATVVFGSPTVLGGAHPQAAYAASLANALRPKTRYASVIGSYGWAGGADKAIAGMIPGLRVEVLDPVLVRGKARSQDLAALDRLAEAIAERHRADKLA